MVLRQEVPVNPSFTSKEDTGIGLRKSCNTSSALVPFWLVCIFNTLFLVHSKCSIMAV